MGVYALSRIPLRAEPQRLISKVKLMPGLHPIKKRALTQTGKKTHLSKVIIRITILVFFARFLAIIWYRNKSLIRCFGKAIDT
jgi:hypothetical protein